MKLKPKYPHRSEIKVHPRCPDCGRPCDDRQLEALNLWRKRGAVGGFAFICGSRQCSAFAWKGQDNERDTSGVVGEERTSYEGRRFPPSVE